MAIVTVGIDLAKNVFAVHGVDEAGKPALVRPEVPRAKLLEPKGFRRARNYGFLHPNSKRLIALLRFLVFKPCRKASAQLAPATQTQRPKVLCRCCGAAMTIVRRRILPVMAPPACPNQEGVASI